MPGFPAKSELTAAAKPVGSRINAKMAAGGGRCYNAVVVANFKELLQIRDTQSAARNSDK